MKIELQQWSMDDLPTLVDHANNSSIAMWMADSFPHPYDETAGRRFIAFAGPESHRIFKIVADGQVAGSIGVHPQHDISRRNAEVGYWIAQPFWGRGIASEAMRQVIPRAFALQEITRLFGRPFPGNMASARVLTKNGFVLEATIANGLFKNGKYFDELIYGLRK